MKCEVVLCELKAIFISLVSDIMTGFQEPVNNIILYNIHPFNVYFVVICFITKLLDRRKLGSKETFKNYFN